MIEGGSSKNFAKIKHLAFNETQFFKDFLEKISEFTLDYLLMQKEHGAEVLMIFDSWAHHLTPTDYKNLVAPSLEKLLGQLKDLNIPTIYYIGQNAYLWDELNLDSFQGLAIDYRTPLSSMKTRIKNHHILQGNLDPSLLQSCEKTVRERTRKILEEAHSLVKGRHIFNVGHGLIPTTNPEALTWAIDEVRRFEQILSTFT